MWDGSWDPDWDYDRFQRIIAGPHEATRRIEVWSDTECLTDSAPILDGEVIHDLVAAGVTRTLSLTAAPSRAWLRWLDYGSLWIRVYRGVKNRGRVMECPLGTFPLDPPEMTIPRSAIRLDAQDYSSYIDGADFTDKPVPQPAGRVVDAIAWLITGAGLPAPLITATSTGRSGEVLLDGTRAEAVADGAQATSTEVYADRMGDMRIADARVLGPATSVLRTGTGGMVKSVAIKPDMSKVINLVSVKSSAQGVEFPAQTAQITWTGHPAHPYRLGSPSRPKYKVLNWSSPLIDSPEAAVKAAQTLLARRSGAAVTRVYLAFPDPTKDAGDSSLGDTESGPIVQQIGQVTHPLVAGDGGDGTPSRVTMVNTQPGDPS